MKKVGKCYSRLCKNKDQFYEEINLNLEGSLILKGIAILLVVVGHLAKEYSVMPYNLRYAGAWGVCIFLVLSGFGITQSYLKSGINVYILVKRLFRVWLPYAIVTGLWIIIDRIFFEKNYKIQTIIFSILGIDLKPVIDGTMWFITFIMIWYVVFYFVFKFSNFKILNIVILFGISIFFHKVKNLQPLSAPYIFDFPIGVGLGLFWTDIKSKLRMKNIIYILTICIIIFCFAYSKIEQGQIYYLLADFSFAFGSISLIIFCELKNLNTKLRSLFWIGNISFEIYIFEGAILFKYKMIYCFNSKFISLIIALVILLISSLILKHVVDVLNKSLFVKKEKLIC